MRLLIAGSKMFGAAVYELLRRDHHIVAVVSPATAKDPTRPDRLRAIAEERGTPWMPDSDLRADRVPANVDLIVAAHCHAFIGRQTRARTRLGAIGYHPSLLPIHRGRDAVEWTIRFRDRVAGGTVYWLTEGIDTGPIAAQAHVLVDPSDTAETLWRRLLFPLGLKLIRKAVDDLSRGLMIRVPQDQRLATWEPSIGRPPIFRPELPMLGSVDGFEVVAAAG